MHRALGWRDDLINQMIDGNGHDTSCPYYGYGTRKLILSDPYIKG